ncbi:hypothetical protein BC777_3298 [Yoonia maricola]|uniref:Uncharacterized protein n=1 Tax=Yoonia maricola TaxID=420999 RepID=A0A2M8W2Z9_9RHOB|nr:hypothetical protein [Yoonia maricola]PJI85297.1 hypothetical protein BC777_3298 [Yoonia maricola]
MTDKKIARMPKAYDAFGPLFAQMDAPLVRVIGGVLRALPARLETAGIFDNQPVGDFVGYDGLENQGALSQLLETEWLLRELDPDDFVRRIAEGEVLFRKRNFQDAGKRNTLAVILDSGPWMLGRNRLVGLAALFHLAVRAERMKADLVWIVPGSQDRGWREGLSRKTIQRYLSQIVQKPLEQDKIDDVLARLDVSGRLDCWYVGSHQTAHMAAHPDVAGAMIVRSHHGATQTNTAEIAIKHRNRTLGRAEITFEDDNTCVTALRRPFKPEVRAKRPSSARAGDDGVLTTSPFQTGWLFDRLNQAAQIHTDEGVLWQPLLPSQHATGIWLPVKGDDVLLGLQVDAKKRLSAMIATPSKPNKQGPQLCETALYEVDLSRGSTAPKARARGVVTIDPLRFAGHPVGNLHVSPQVSIVRNDGTRNIFEITDEGRLNGPRRVDHRVLLTNETYRVQIERSARPKIEVISINRDNLMMHAPLINADRHLTKAPRHVLYAPHTKVVAMSFDGQDYEVYGLGKPFNQTIPDGLTLLYLDNASQALAWNAEHAELIRLSFHQGKIRQNAVKQYHGPRTQVPRHCAMTGVTIALQTDENGRPEYVVPIHAKKGWRNVTPLKINDAIERARTVWLDS